MDKMKKDTVKLAVYITKDTSEKFNRYAEMLGITKSALGNMCILIGLANYTRMIEPEKVMSELDWMNLLKAVKMNDVQGEALIRKYDESKSK
jgi:hypothetical protein